MSEEDQLLITHEDAIVIATLNRPEKLNAITPHMLRKFRDTLLTFRDTPSQKVLLVQATGRYFCAGMDLRAGGGGHAPPRNAGGFREQLRIGLNGMHDLYNEMEAIEKPIVAAHQAPCWGGGLELSLSCDFRLASSNANYAFPEGKFGSLPASNGVSRLTRIVGTHWARYLVMANLPAPAERALVMGLVHEVFPAETFEEDVMKFVRHLAQQHQEQMGAAKLAIEMARDVGLAQARNVERLANSSLMMSPDFQELMVKHLATSVGGKKKE